MSFVTNAKEYHFQGEMSVGEAVALGYDALATPVYKLGFNASITGVNQEDMWNVGGAYVFPAAEMQMEVVSSDNTNDKAGGTGALTVTITYLTAAFVEKTHTFTMNGTAAVASGAGAADIYRVNSFRVATAGATGAATGDISLRHLSDTPVYSQIAVGQTRGRNMAYTVPVGKKLVIQTFECSSSGTAGTSYLKFTLRAKYSDLSQAASTIEFPQFEIAVQTAGMFAALPQPIVIPAGVDTHVVVIGDAATSTATATCAWRGFLLPA